MKARWGLVLLPSFILMLILIGSTQYAFLKNSFFRDLGLGRTSDELDLSYYLLIFSDSFYLRTFWITIKTSALAAIITLLLSYPLAYVIARMRSKWAMVLLASVVVSNFITIVIKVFGIIIIFSGDGPLNSFLKEFHLINRPYSIMGTETGVVVGLMHFTLGFGILLLYSIIQTIPESLEEAAQIHGASRLKVFARVIFPLSLPGITVSTLMCFSMCMGAFTSAALLGAGKVLTLPVLIQRKVMMEVQYSMSAALGAVLLFSVLLINLCCVYMIRRFGVPKKGMI
jgi:putative spermidine/putrescine transport system permease protein